MLPSYTYLDITALFLYFWPKDNVIHSRHFKSKNFKGSISLYKDGYIKIKEKEPTRIINHYYRMNADELHKFVLKYKGPIETITKFDRINLKDGFIEANQRNLKNPIVSTPKTSNEITLPMMVREGYKIMEKIQLPSYVEFLKSQPIEPEEKISFEQRLFSEIANIQAEIETIAEKIGKQEEAKFMIASILEKQLALFEKKVIVVGNLTLHGGEAVLKATLIEMQAYFYMIRDAEKAYIAKQEIKEKQEQFIKKTGTSNEIIISTIEKLKEMALYLNKEEEAQEEINKYNASINILGGSNTSLLRLFDYYSKLETMYKEKKETDEISNGFNDLINMVK